MQVILTVIVLILFIVGVFSLVIFLAMAFGNTQSEKEESAFFLTIFVICSLSMTALSTQRNLIYTNIAKENIEVYPLKGKDSTVVDYQIIRLNK